MKTPIEINIGKDGSVKINVDMERQGQVRAAAATSVDREAQDLELRLIALDDKDETKTLATNMDVLRFVEKKLKAGQRKDVLEFLNKNKHRFDTELKEWLRDTIVASRVEKKDAV